jgi:hypothetical protein
MGHASLLISYLFDQVKEILGKLGQVIDCIGKAKIAIFTYGTASPTAPNPFNVTAL